MGLILASASPRRAELLRAAGYEFTTRAVEVDERVPPGESPHVYVRRLAAEKSFAAQAQRGPAHARRDPEIFLGADTAVVVDAEILGKPADAADARRMLRMLAGRQHEVITGVSLRRGAYELGRVAATTVEFAPMSDADVSWYVSTAEGVDKAGGYAIQGLASRFVCAIHGSYSNVVGLPIHVVRELLADIASGG